MPDPHEPPDLQGWRYLKLRRAAESDRDLDAKLVHEVQQQKPVPVLVDEETELRRDLAEVTIVTFLKGADAVVAKQRGVLPEGG
jgi:hypothetical protein